MEVKRKCSKCPEWTRTVCKHAFAERWNEKSHGGDGCDHPLDDVAEAWRKNGWLPQAEPQPPRRPLPTRPAAKQDGKLTSLVDKFKKGIKK